VDKVFLKSIEIFGFKSFADKTRIDFAPGISALLGPNGCGKSNVVDAIKWVLGEQSARSIRAEEMADVIFNGTENRKALNVAEVSLTISNEPQILPIDVSEVVIKRRLYRSGENEYFINNKQVKLRELRELFWDTGVGKSAYSVMEQGRIDQILSSKPEDRRYLFEEAAGITKHKVRSREAELKLKTTEENMRQVEGILGEIKKTYETLKVQSEKTMVYRKLKNDIFELERDMYLIRLRGFINEKSKQDDLIAKKTKERDELKKEIDSINASLEQNLDAVNSMESKLVELQRTIYGLVIEKNGKEKEKSMQENWLREARDKLAQLELKIKQSQDKIESLQEEEDEKTANLLAFSRQLADTKKNITEFEQSINNAEAAITRNEETVQRAEEEIASKESQIINVEKELETVADNLVVLFDERLKEIGYSSKERSEAEIQFEHNLALLKTKFENRKNRIDDFIHTQVNFDTLVEFIKTSFGEFTDILNELTKSYENLKRLNPSFVDEFLGTEGVITKKRAIDSNINSIKSSIEALRNVIKEKREENKTLSGKIQEYRKTLDELKNNMFAVQSQAQRAEESLQLLRRDRSTLGENLRELENEKSVLLAKMEEIHAVIAELSEEIDTIEKKGRELTKNLESIEQEIAVRNSDVGKRQEESRKKVDKLLGIQTELETCHMSLAQTETEIKNIKDMFMEQHGRDLMEFEERMWELRSSIGEIREQLTDAKQKLKELGQVNLMAPEEFGEVKERYEFLNSQYEDLVKACTDLKLITKQIREESAELFVTTYNLIKKNFHNIFRRLFAGGRAELKLVDPDHVLESGIEIYAQPPGKKLENISLLSGGERSMTAIALLFATYMVKPSPFCFLDEIDAALDEQNVIAFVNLLREFGKTSQFIVITHNKKTVTGADALLGVTMEESGITKVIAVRIERSDGKEITLQKPLEVMLDEDIEYEHGRELETPPVQNEAITSEGAPELNQKTTQQSSEPKVAEKEAAISEQ